MHLCISGWMRCCIATLLSGKNCYSRRLKWKLPSRTWLRPRAPAARHSRWAGIIKLTHTHRHAIDTGMHHTHLDCFIALCSQSRLWEVSCHIPFAHGSRQLRENASQAGCKVDNSFVLQNAEKMQNLVYTLQRNLRAVQEAKTEAVTATLYRALL